MRNEMDCASNCYNEWVTTQYEYVQFVTLELHQFCYANYERVKWLKDLKNDYIFHSSKEWNV